VAGFGRIVLVGTTVAVVLGTAALHAQTALEDPRNAPKIFANTCSACHKSPQGLAKSGGTASFLRQHYTTGPEMSAAMASYLAAAGNAPASKKNDKKEPAGPATAAKETPGQKRTAGHPFTDGSTDVSTRPSAREKQKAGKSGEPKQGPGSHAAARGAEPPPERTAPTAQSAPAAPSAPPAATAALATPPAAEPPAAPPVTLDIPMPDFPSGPPADLTQPAVFSSAPLP
jgi:hypothetical protein